MIIVSYSKKKVGNLKLDKDRNLDITQRTSVTYRPSTKQIFWVRRVEIEN